MFDSFFNVLFVIAAVGFFVIRTVVQARKKQGDSEAPPPQPHIPVHFEDDDDEDEVVLELFKAKAPAPVQPAAQAVKPGPVFTPLPETVFKSSLTPPEAAFTQPLKTASAAVAASPALPAAVKSVSPAAATYSSGASPGRKDFFLRLSNLSAMKQAVVMAEVLGTPKGMQ